MIILLIKGNKADALRAAKDRAIHLLEIDESSHQDHREIRATVSNNEIDAVQRWYGEEGAAPYPPGTLLYYIDRRDVK